MFKSTRVKTPTVLQMEAVECGAASLAMILAYYGLHLPLEELRDVCGVSRDGSKASDLVNAAEEYGLEANGAFVSIEELEEDNDFPVIVFWERCHFVVLEGIKGDKVFLNDPAVGHRIVTREEFKKSYSHLSIYFKKTDKFVPGNRTEPMYKFFFKITAGNYRALAVILFSSLMLILPGLAIPAFSKVFIDDILIAKNTHWLNPLIVAMVGVLVVQVSLGYLRNLVTNKLNMKLALKTNSKFFWHILHVPVAFFGQRSLGDVLSRLNNNQSIARLIATAFPSTILDLFQVVVYLVAMTFYTWQLTVVLLVNSVIDIAVFLYSKKLLRDCNLRAQIEGGKMYGAIMSGLNLIETIKATAAENNFLNKIIAFLTKVTNANQSVMKINMMVTLIASTITNLSSAIVLGYGGYLIIEGKLTIGGLIGFIALSGTFKILLDNLVGFSTQLQLINADIMRVNDVYNYETDTRYNQTKSLGKLLAGRVEFKDIVFGYDKKEPPLLENISITIEPGKRVALVGGSGSGKSTLAKLLTGLYKPWSGTITIDGIPINELSPADLAATVSMVDQEIFLFSGKLNENISLWDDNADHELMVEATKDAEIFDVISSRPHGFNMELSEGGSNLSGGQCQRLEIARALLARTPVIILDEAMSALDPIIEQKIDLNIRKYGKTTMVVAHRLSTIRDCDEIVVMQTGKIIERGTHDQLMSSKGYYSELMGME